MLSSKWQQRPCAISTKRRKRNVSHQRQTRQRQENMDCGPRGAGRNIPKNRSGAYYFLDHIRSSIPFPDRWRRACPFTFLLPKEQEITTYNSRRPRSFLSYERSKSVTVVALEIPRFRRSCILTVKLHPAICFRRPTDKSWEPSNRVSVS